MFHANVWLRSLILLGLVAAPALAQAPAPQPKKDPAKPAKPVKAAK